MASTYGTIKTNVGNRVNDTSTPMATLIGTWVNQRYKEVLRRTNWNAINPDFSITATSASTTTSASTYTLPSDFGKELYVYNTGTELEIIPTTLDQIVQENPDEVNAGGTIEKYAIFETTNSTAASAEASAARVKKIRFWRYPQTDTYFLIPYTMRPADLSSSADHLAVDCETAVEYGAVADAWMYKRNFAKAQYYEALYEKAIQTLMWDKDYSVNGVPQMNVKALDRNDGI